MCFLHKNGEKKPLVLLIGMNEMKVILIMLVISNEAGGSLPIVLVDVESIF